MEYRPLGRSGLRVSAMSLGTNAFGDRADETAAVALVQQALDAGINLIDTADVYQRGEAERIVGVALRGRRSQAVLATKVCKPMGDGPHDAGASRQHILDAVDASLRRLGTDYIDLYQIHQWDPATPLEETLRTLDDLVRWGKVRYIGCSNFAAWQIVKALAISDRHGWARFISNQPEYSPARRDIEREILPMGLSEGVGQIVYWALAGGLFTGKYRRGEDPPPGSRATRSPLFTNKGWLTDPYLTLTERLTAIADAAGLRLPHLVLAWVMARPGVTSAIVGATRVEQLTDNLAACDVRLPADVMAAVDACAAVV